MRNRPLNLKSYNLDAWEYKELYAICRQYRKLKGNEHKLAAMKVSAIETAAFETLGEHTEKGQWADAIIATCCDGLPINKTAAANQRFAFYAARREFFYRLWILIYGNI